MSPLDALREAFVADDIDIETFERVVGALVADESVSLPDVVEKRLYNDARLSALRDWHG